MTWLDFTGYAGDVEVVVNGVIQQRYLATPQVPARHDVELTFVEDPWSR